MEDALAALRSVPEAEFATRDRAVRTCMIDRFGAEADGSLPIEAGPFAGRAIGIYRAYWRAALLRPERRAAEEERLHRNLARLAGTAADADRAVIDAALRERFAGEGLHILAGRTPPLLELIVWDEETEQRRSVPLPEGEHEVTVRILDDFASLGWSAYATCDRSFTGGWVSDDAIYAVRPGWRSLDDENFRISFLAHETQHFADRARFGELPSWELEYRAKLAELALAENTLPRLLSAFESNQAEDPSLPHSYANRQVLAAMRGELALAPTADPAILPPEALNQAARTLLLRDSARREESRGAR